MRKNTRVVLSIMLLASCFMVAIPAPASATAAIANPNDLFAMLPETFTFASGAGGWWTDVHINADGTFTGLYQDWDMGDRGDGYPNGTKYECYFSGAFTDIVNVSDFEYSMRIATLQTQGSEGEEKIIDEVRVITAGPYGFDRADEFRLYLPGMATIDLPQAYISWVGWPLTRTTADGSASKVLMFYGLYNIGGEQGFYSDDVLNTQGTVSSTYITGMVTVTQHDSVSLRNRANESGNRIARIPAGETCLCVGRGGYGWYKVFYNDYIGYVPSSAVEFSAQGAQTGRNSEALGVVQIVSSDFVNVRSAPDQNSEWLAGVSTGVSLDYIDVAKNGWYCVVLPSGQTGYISNKLCTPW